MGGEICGESPGLAGGFRFILIGLGCGWLLLLSVTVSGSQTSSPFRHGLIGLTS